MWADTLLAAERAHLLRLATWAMASVVTGTALLALLRVQRRVSPVLSHFAFQVVAWGAIELLLAWIARSMLALRDMSGAVGLMLAVSGWVMGRRLAAVGAGTGIVVQGLALFALDLLFASRLASLV